MNVGEILLKTKTPSCEYCSQYKKCKLVLDKDWCEFVNPEPDNTYKSQLVEAYINNTNNCSTYSVTKELTHSGYRNRYVAQYDDKNLLFINFVNNCLNDIENGLTAYAYTLEQVKLILRMQPKTNVVYSDDIYYLSLNRI